ncbi:PhzF family phenazine biosynthesis protein [Streptomyces sp. NBC_00237]|uniref:PhzF family phenazine biosynthesis protein n=1 Tax=Streptomyces sp. NBC_00237 TaxID=2975687 RepID=UPI002257F419|nr:PhzF family phenazine biosynthesis isomerase [Streptomyces sp. NBC_00237]MCX5206784.1 PhzF family phenazine biosynthesis protein [Streptomyces sp. NBC_00237]
MQIRTVDAFTSVPFHGNPAAILLLEDATAFPENSWLQYVAAELNLAETAFAHPLPPTGGSPLWALRWFTPTDEVTMCGHATLATAHVLRTTGLTTGPVDFSTRSGILTAAPNADGSHTLDFPTAPLLPTEAPDGLAEALGTEPLTVLYTGDQVGDLLVEITSEKEIRDLAPDLKALAALSRRGVIATALAEDPARGYDFVSRCFFPAYGIDEDPVTGSAHTALAPFWSERLGRTELTGFQGGRRTGLVRTSLQGDRTHLTGHAVTVLESELLVSP